MSTLGLYFHTIRHLRLSQIAARLRLGLYRPRNVDLRPPPPLRTIPHSYTNPVARAPTLVAQDTFRFLNVKRRCASVADWHPPQADKLWIYNLHYFDDLNADEAASRHHWHEALLLRWVAENPPGQGVAWEPYPTSLRIVNWVKWALRGNPLPAPVRASLATQMRWLSRRLEYHILGNHLLANAKALLYGGLYFSGQEAESWRVKGSLILSRELREQILADGGHFELSPMYHALVLEDLLDLINVQQACGLSMAHEWEDAVQRMQRWLRVMNQPDGEIPFFNDAAFGIAPRCDVLQQYADRLGLQVEDAPREALCLLRDSGYARLRAGQAYLLCDCGPVGPPHQPGHAHADTLSFELSLGGQRVFVNSGTSRYGTGPERQRQRSTSAHNTVVVDGHDSSEVWAGFRVARRAHAFIRNTRAHDVLMIEASHDGYRRLPGRNEHCRRWELQENSLSIEDSISGRFNSAEAFFHLHPTVTADCHDGSRVVLSRFDGVVAEMDFDGADAVVVTVGSWHPSFGESENNRCIQARFSGGRLVTSIRWTNLP